MTIILEINPAQDGKDRAAHPLPVVIKLGVELGMGFLILNPCLTRRLSSSTFLRTGEHETPLLRC